MKFRAGFAAGGVKRKELLAKITRFVITSCLPTSVVDCDEFRDLLATFETPFTLPGRTQFADIVIPSAFKYFTEQVFNLLSKTNYVAFTGDGWSRADARE